MKLLDHRRGQRWLTGWFGSLLLGGFIFLAVTKSTVFGEKSFPHPMHPTIIYGMRKGHEYPIIAVSGKRPQIRVNGKLRKLAKRDSFRIDRADAFLMGKIAIIEEKHNYETLWVFGKFSDVLRLTNATILNDRSRFPNGTIFNDQLRRPYGEDFLFMSKMKYEANLKPDRIYENCYAALFVFGIESLKSESEAPIITFSFKDIGTLKPEEDYFLVMDFPKFESDISKGEFFGFFPLFFSNGREILSSDMQIPRYVFDALDRINHKRLFEAHLEKNFETNDKLVPFRQFPIALPASFSEKLPKENVILQLYINEAGFVDRITLPDEITGELREHIENTVLSWMYLPKIMNGEYVRTKVSVPLSFN